MQSHSTFPPTDLTERLNIFNQFRVLVLTGQYPEANRLLQDKEYRYFITNPLSPDEINFMSNFLSDLILIYQGEYIPNSFLNLIILDISDEDILLEVMNAWARNLFDDPTLNFTGPISESDVANLNAKIATLRPDVVAQLQKFSDRISEILIFKKDISLTAHNDPIEDTKIDLDLPSSNEEIIINVNLKTLNEQLLQSILAQDIFSANAIWDNNPLLQAFYKGQYLSSHQGGFQIGIATVFILLDVAIRNRATYLCEQIWENNEFLHNHLVQPEHQSTQTHLRDIALKNGDIILAGKIVTNSQSKIPQSINQSSILLSANQLINLFANGDLNTLKNEINNIQDYKILENVISTISKNSEQVSESASILRLLFMRKMVLNPLPSNFYERRHSQRHTPQLFPTAQVTENQQKKPVNQSSMQTGLRK